MEATGGSPESFDIIGIDANPDRTTRAIFGFNYFRIGEEIGTTVDPSNQRRVMVINGSTGELLLNIQPGLQSASVENQMVIDAINSVEAEPTDPYLVWSTAQGLSELQNGEQDDPDHDGLVNLLEYAFGSNPLGSDSPLTRPRVTKESGNNLQFIFQRSKAADVTPFSFQQSMNLENFLPFTPDANDISVQDQGDTELVTITLSGSDPQLFLSLSTGRP